MTQPKPPAAFRKQVLALLGERYGDKTLILCPTVFVRLLGGDHKAAILLSQILYWSDRTKDPAGWFYKSYSDWTLETGFSEAQVRRIVNGDPRVQSAQTPLRALGVETVLRKVKRTGAPTLHYRINQPRFLAALQSFLESGDSQAWTGSTPELVQDEPPPLPAIDPDQSAGSLIPPETSFPEISSEDQPPPTSFKSADEDQDLALFLAFEARFGKFKASRHDTFRAQVERLGHDTVGQVLERCAQRGHSWNYVERALLNETAPSRAAQPAHPDRLAGFQALAEANPRQACAVPFTPAQPVSERLQQPWQPTGAPVLTVWQAAYQQMEAQFDRANFVTCFADLRLVDFEPETNTLVVAVRNAEVRALIEGRLARMLRRILNDVAGQALRLRCLTAEDWSGMSGPAACSA